MKLHDRRLYVHDEGDMNKSIRNNFIISWAVYKTEF